MVDHTGLPAMGEPEPSFSPSGTYATVRGETLVSTETGELWPIPSGAWGVPTAEGMVYGWSAAGELMSWKVGQDGWQVLLSADELKDTSIVALNNGRTILQRHELADEENPWGPINYTFEYRTYS